MCLGSVRKKKRKKPWLASVCVVMTKDSSKHCRRACHPTSISHFFSCDVGTPAVLLIHKVVDSLCSKPGMPERELQKAGPCWLPGPCTPVLISLPSGYFCCGRSCQSHHMVWRISVPQPAVAVPSLNHWTAREIPLLHFIHERIHFLICLNQ